MKTAAAILGIVMIPFAAAAQERGGADADATAQAGLQDPQPAAASQGGEASEDNIVIQGARRRGVAVGDYEPEVSLSPADVEAYGVSTLGELLAELAPQTGSGRGRGGGGPVVLLNGRRIAGFREIRNYPPEAIERVDVLPEEAALKYGFRADQRVINFVLKDRFQAVRAEIEGTVTTEGGREGGEIGGNVLRIRDKSRISFDLEYERSEALLESERDVFNQAPSRPFDLVGNVEALVPGDEIDPALSALAGETTTIAGAPDDAVSAAPSLADFAERAGEARETDQRGFRTLLPETDRYEIGGLWYRPVGERLDVTLSAGFEQTDALALRGLPSAEFVLPAANPFSPFADDVALYRFLGGLGALESETRNRNWNAGLTVSDEFAPWRWTLNATWSREDAKTTTEREADVAAEQSQLDAGDPDFNPYAAFSPANGLLADFAETTTDAIGAEFTSNGPLFPVPAGEATGSVKLGASVLDLSSFSRTDGFVQDQTLERDRLVGAVTVDLPLTSRDYGVAPALGDVSLNANFEAEDLSDFGTLYVYGGGLNWRPFDIVRLNVSATREEGAPGVGQLGNPLIATPNVRVFDFATGEDAEVTRLDGGNPALLADERDVLDFGLQIEPFDETEFTLTANYVIEEIRDRIESFPSATAEIQAAFPERFTRDASGVLVEIDSRPVNFDQSNRQEIRWGFNYRRNVGGAERRSSGDASSRPAGGGAGSRGAPPQGGASQGNGGGGPPGGAAMFQNMPETCRTFLRTLREKAQGAETPEARAAAFANLAEDDVPPECREIVARIRERMAAGGASGAPSGRSSETGGRPSGGRPSGGGRLGRMWLSVYHTYRIEETILIRDGVPELDLLDGSAIGARGGTPRHEVQLNTGLWNDGVGYRVAARWESGTTVRAGLTGSSPEDLEFSDLATIDLFVFTDLSRRANWVARHPWLEGTRVSLAVRNVFDAKQEVRNGLGETPFNVQEDVLDPRGRQIGLEFRKLFQ